MEFTTEDIGGVAVGRLKGVLDSAGVVRLQESVENQLIGRDRKVVLDFSEIDALDPMGLAELLKLSRWVKDGGFRLRVAHAAFHVEEAFRDNMISDVEFFRDVDAATKYAAEAPPPLREEKPPPPQPKPPPRPGFLKRYGWVLGAGAAVVILGVVATVAFSKLNLFQKKEIEFLTEDGQPWSSDITLSLKPGEEQVLKFTVRNADQILPIRNESWVDMRVKPGEDDTVREVTYRFAPEKDFPPTDTYFYVTTGEGKERRRTKTIYLTSDVEAVLPKFQTGGRDYENHGNGVEGFLLAAGIQGEQYGPDGISATGGSHLRYSASGHEKFGLEFDTVTGRFSGEPQQPTPDGEYVPIKITAKNETGEESITALLYIEKEKVIESTRQAANTYAEEIQKRFDLLNLSKLQNKDIRLLFEYKDAIKEQRDGDIYKVGTVFFPVGATKLSLEYQRRLDSEFEVERFRELAADKSTYFFVLGFADKGNTSDSVNLPLIESRANSLRDYLTDYLKKTYGTSATELAERVRVIPMRPVPDENGQPIIFNSRERSRAGEIWLLKDPRRKD